MHAIWHPVTLTHESFAVTHVADGTFGALWLAAHHLNENTVLLQWFLLYGENSRIKLLWTFDVLRYLAELQGSESSPRFQYSCMRGRRLLLQDPIELKRERS